MLFEDISEIISDLKKRIEEKKYKIILNKNNFNILFKDDITNINEITIELKRKEEDLKTIVESLNSIIKIQGEKINKYLISQ